MKPIFNSSWPLIGALILLLCLPMQQQAQHSNPTHKFVQFFVENLNTVEEARVIDHFIRTQPDIFISRTDVNTGLCFIIFSINANFDENTFTTWLASLGHSITCYREGIHRQDPVYSREQYPCNP